MLQQANFFYKKLQSIQKVEKKNTKLNSEILSVLLLFAYPDRLAKRRSQNDNKYKLSNAKGAVLNHEDSLFNEKYLVVANLNAQDKDSFINLALAISLENIQKYCGKFIIEKESITYNKNAQKFDIRQNSYFLHLQLHSKPLQTSQGTDFEQLLLELIRQEGLSLLSWSKKANVLKNRINFIQHHMPFVNLSDDKLMDTLESWLSPFLSNITTIKALQSLDLYTILYNSLSWENKQILDIHAPLSVQVPSGSNIHIDYSEVEKPSIHVKIQEVFGLHETPKVLNNTISLQIHLLTPAMTPMQITYDLKSFWENSYSEVRKEVRGKYKRHYWPENPFEAIATNKTKKHMMKQESR